MLGQLIDRKTDLGGKVEFYVGDVKSSIKEKGQVRSWILKFRVQRRILD